MEIRLCALCLGFLLLTTLRSPATDNMYVRFSTSLGNIDVQLLSDEAPGTVANFLSYVNGTTNSYTNSIIHRVGTPSVDGVSVIQGGGFYNTAFPPPPITTNPPITNEFSVSNTMGTIAMAKFGSDPNSATSQWYFNVTDNTALDTIDGGFTVFGRITNATGLSVMAQIANVPTFTDGGANDGGALQELPLLNFDPATSGNPSAATYVNVFAITVLTMQDFSTWQSTNFPGQPSNVTAPTATPLNDGVPNLLKYAFDINPTRPMTGADLAKLPVPGRITGGTTPVQTLTFHQYFGLTGVTTNIQTSSDMKTWTTVTNPTIVQTGVDSTTHDSILQAQVPVSAGAPHFIRLNISQP